MLLHPRVWCGVCFLLQCEEVKGAAPGSGSKAVTDAAARAYVTAVFEQLAATRVTKTGMRKYKLPLGNLRCVVANTCTCACA